MTNQTNGQNQQVDSFAVAYKPKVSVRIRGGILLGLIIGLNIAAFFIVPSDRGFGTHKKLGMISCGYLARTGYPCPGCGVTTSLTASFRFDFLKAVKSHIFGMVIYLILVIIGIVGALELWTGKSYFSRFKPNHWWLFTLVGLFLGGWLIKTAVGVWIGTYPIH